MAEPYSFGIDPIGCHAWNKNRTKLAISPNNNEVHIYEKNGADWKLSHVLQEHDLRVTGIDWAPNTDRIVTCSADRNAYVWCQDSTGKWLPTLVLLRINRAATCVRWSPLENKFAVGSGARLISICYFEKENNWWVSKHIKKPIRSTVTSIDWHPNNVLIACGSTDYKARVFSAWIKDIEDKPSPTTWGVKMPLQQLMAEFPCSSNGGGWVHCVSFSEDGTKLCWVGHDSSVSVVDSANNMVMYNLKTDTLPFLSCLWLSDSLIVAAGHGCCPMLYSMQNGQLTFVGKLDSKQKKESTGISAFKRFQTMDRQNRSEIEDTSLGTVHQNAITGICLYKGTKSSATHFSTAGVDGQIVVWDFKSLESSMKNLKI